MSAPTLRIRGIYATALTERLLAADYEVVQASGPIERRFEESFRSDGHDVAVETSDDRQGVGVAGDPDTVDAVTGLLAETGLDTLAWADSHPVGAIHDGRVTETAGGGAVVDVGDGEGYLPFHNAADRIDIGDGVRVQVVEAAPPWANDRPLLDTRLRARGGLAALVPGQESVTVDTRDDDAGRELAGMTDLLGIDAPDGWGIHWSRAATEADVDALQTGIARATDRALAIEDALDGDLDGGTAVTVGDPRRLVSTDAGSWVWFGRESRFALDARRRAVTTTMPGHHRIKAAADAASAGVDLVEALCQPDGDDDFPFSVVADQFGPRAGDEVRIAHGKPDGRLVVLGRGTVTERTDDGTVAVTRELSGGGTYDALDVPRRAGDVALTKFREGRWWYPTVYRGADGDLRGTYVNICTPVECFPDEVRYVDLHVDVIKRADGTVERVDDDELDAAAEAGHLSPALAEKARSVASALENAL
ncbi:DUF402 domain-containing protein [Haloferacaceae archaeon DSL9]